MRVVAPHRLDRSQAGRLNDRQAIQYVQGNVVPHFEGQIARSGIIQKTDEGDFRCNQQNHAVV